MALRIARLYNSSSGSHRLPTIRFNSSFSTNRAFQPSSRESSVQNYDIVIVGGGVVGLTLANALASSEAVLNCGYRVAVLDAAKLSKVKTWELSPDQWSNRVSSVTNENLGFLSHIGVLQHLDKKRTNPVERMQVWDGLSGARIVFDSLADSAQNPLGTPHIPQMARFIENLHLQRAMLQNLDGKRNVDVYDSTKVDHIVADETNWPIVTMEDGKKFRTRLLVGADGFNSPVKSYSQITSTGWNYDSHCVVGTLELVPTGYNYTAWQRFLTSGPLGFLPLSDRCASLAWSTKPDIAAALKKLDGPCLASIVNACFQLPHESVQYLLSLIVSQSTCNQVNSDQVQAEIDWRVSSFFNERAEISEDELPPKVLNVRMDTVASFPLKMFHADRYIGHNTGAAKSEGNLEVDAGAHRTVLVGDAAHVLHPMAGQGLNMGLGDAKELASTVSDAVLNGQDIGASTTLLRYSRSRYLTNHLVMATVDKLYKLYSIQTPPVVWARSVGVEVLNEVTPLKAAMMAGAGGKVHSGLQSSRSGIWSKVADIYEAASMAKTMAEGLGGLALGSIKSTLHRATTP